MTRIQCFIFLVVLLLSVVATSFKIKSSDGASTNLLREEPVVLSKVSGVNSRAGNFVNFLKKTSFTFITSPYNGINLQVPETNDAIITHAVQGRLNLILHQSYLQ